MPLLEVNFELHLLFNLLENGQKGNLYVIKKMSDDTGLREDKRYQ